MCIKMYKVFVKLLQMQGTIKLSPIITYNPSTQVLDIHSICQTLRYKHIKFISIIEVKAKDYKIFGTSFQQLFHDQKHGIYVSYPFQLGEAEDQEYFAYLILPANQGRVAEKIQDLLAGIALMLSNVCIFDISSKYLRLSKNVEQRPERINYVVMSSHSNGSELYRANISNQNNKMQITTKLQSEQKILMEQLTKNIKTKYILQQINKVIRNELNDIFLLKNYISFQEVAYKILGQVRIFQYLEQFSKDFMQVWYFDDKISIFQMGKLQNCIDKYASPELGSSDQAPILVYCKSLIKQQIRLKNTELNKKFISQLKEQYFKEIISQNQLIIKIQLCEKILEEYGIELDNLPILFSQSSQRLQKEHNNKQLGELVQKYKKIQELEQNLILCEKKMLKYQEALGVYESKNFDFKELNNKYIEKCGQLDKQRNTTRKYKLQIECMLLEMQRKNSIEESLNKLIKESELNKENLTKSLLQSQMQLKNKEKYIFELQNRNQEFLTKIKNHQNLQGQAWKCIEETQSAHEQLRRYKELLQKLEDHFEVFKKKEIQKFNYILKKNSQQYLKLKKQLESKNLILQQYQNKIDKLGGELEEQKSRLKFCQEQIWINKNYMSSNLNSSSIKKHFESFSNRQQTTKQESTCKNFIVA